MNDEQLQSSLQHAVDLHRAGRLDQAVRLYRRVLSQAPDHPQALHLLGAALSQSGDHRSALEPLQRAVKLLPREPGAAHNLGLALKGMGRLEEAARALERALDLDPAFEPARAALAGLSPVLASRAQDEHRRDLAIAWLQRCLELRPDHAEARNNLAIALQETGRIPEARDQFRRALADAPNNPVIHSNLLFGLHHDPDAGPETRLREARSYGARRPQPETIPAPQPASGRPLRVGYLSADFSGHAVSTFTLPLLEAHDPELIQVTAFSNAPLSGEAEQRLSRAVASVRCVRDLDDDDALQRLRDADLDLLVDLSGHTRGNRLPVLARRAAPVQAVWLGYFDTTGVEAMDCILADERCCPPGAERWFTERIVRLPDSFFCYTPPEAGPEPAESPPCLDGEPFTFASFNEAAKLNTAVVAVWAEILRQAPHARLLLKAKGFADASVRRRFAELFADRGIAPERLVLEGPSSHAQYLARHRDVDLVLDPFPYNGGTVTCDALWMGVPVLTLAGESMAGRMGLSVLHAAGLEGWACNSLEEYVRRAAATARAPEELARLRAGQRKRVLASPLGDTERFSANLIQAYRRMVGAG